MRCSHLWLVGELTKALYSVAPATPDALTAPSASFSNAVAASRQVGRITEWDPFERRGVIEDEAGHRYHIASTRAFETVLPTMLRTLDGAVVEFDVDRKATADRVIIRSRLAPITAESYCQKPPVNFLSPEMLGHLKPATLSRRGAASVAEEALPDEGTQRSTHAPVQDVRLFAKNITVDIGSIPAKQIARWSGPLSEEEVIKPTKNLKDMRSSRLFDRETNAYLKLRQQLGDGEKAKRILAEQAVASAVHREVVAESASGVILAWSGIHRSGLLREEKLDGSQAASATNEASSSSSGGTVTVSADGDEAVCIIRNVNAFKSALPTSQSLLERRVTFTKVTYSTQPHRFFAENIEVAGEVTYDNAVASLEEAHAARQKERAASLRSGRPGALILEDGGDFGAEGPRGAEGGASTPAGAAHVHSGSSATPGQDTAADMGSAAALDPHRKEDPVDPHKVYYGVVVRWSGGQGVVEGGDGGHYFLRSAADFVQLVDQSSHQLRGAVVQFKRDPANPRYAREVDILSTATSTLSEMKPMLERPYLVVRGHVADGGAARDDLPATSTASDVEPEGVDWVYGTLLSWSPVELQGIVLSDADAQARYVLRDPEENVIAYAATQHLLKKGRQVKFTTFGSTGRLVCNLVLLGTETEEEVLQEAELRPKEPAFSMDGNMNEAIPSPMSTSYWLNRMDKAGYDTKEVKDLQNRALTLDEDEDDDGTEGGKFLDSEELLKKDHWWNDPRKNVRFPNSDMTAGHLALIGPASMMNVAMKTKDPKKMDKMLKKYQSRLTEDQKEYAWKQAKEMAPKYEECVRKGRERNEEPKFYFF